MFCLTARISSRQTVLPASQVRTYARKTQQLSKKDTSVQVILTQSVPKIGEEGEVLSVKRGFARNYLFPRDFAVIATPEAREQYKDIAQQIDFVARERQKNVQRAKKNISKVVIYCKRQSILGTPHAPVHRVDISKTLWKQARIDLDPAKIAHDVTTFGLHEIPITLGDDTTYNAALKVHLLER